MCQQEVAEVHPKLHGTGRSFLSLQNLNQFQHWLKWSETVSAPTATDEK